MTAAAASSTDKTRARAERRKALREIRMSYLFLLPYLILLVMFGVFPVAYAFGLSFFDTIEMVFWGLTNYDFKWHLGDRFTLLSDGYADVFAQGLRQIGTGDQARLDRRVRDQSVLDRGWRHILTLRGLE